MTVRLSGHLIDSLTLTKVIDLILKAGGSYELNKLEVARDKNDISVAILTVTAAENTIATAETNATDSSHLTTGDLTAAGANAALNLALYADGDFVPTGQLTITDYTTGPAN